MRFINDEDSLKVCCIGRENNFILSFLKPLDVDNDTSGWPILLLIVIGVPMIIAGIVCGVLYSQMKTARLKTEANDYIGAGLKLRVQVDNYTHTDRVQVYDPPHEESSSSGGSSVDSDGFGGSSGGSF